MASRSSGDSYQAVGPLLHRLLCKLVVDHVVKHRAPVAVHRLVHIFPGAERRDDEGHLVSHASFEVVLEPIVGAVHDLINGKRGRRPVGVCLIVLLQLRLDLCQPLVQLLFWAGIQGGEGADNPCLALRDDERRVGDDEERGPDDRYTQTALQRLCEL